MAAQLTAADLVAADLVAAELAAVELVAVKKSRRTAELLTISHFISL